MVKKNKRFLSIFCCLALLLALIPPLPASAAVVSDHVTESSGDGYALYNGVKLPNIDSVWTDKESYPYGYLIKPSATTPFMLRFSNVIWQVAPNDNNVYYLGPISDCTLVTYRLIDGVWTFVNQSSVSAGAHYSMATVCKWSSFDIINTTDQSVYLSASAPIPLDGMTVIEWDGDTSGLLESTSGGSFKVSDSLLTLNDFVGRVAVGISGDYHDGLLLNSQDIVEGFGGLIFGYLAYSVPADGVFPESGTYFCWDDSDGLVYTSVFAYTPAETTTPTYLIDGTWQFDPTISGDDFSLEATFSCEAVNFSGAGITYDSTMQQLTFTGDGMNDVVAWSAASGWLSEDYRTIVFDDEYSLDETAFSWFVSNAFLLRDAAGDVPNYTTVTIGDQTFVFWAYDQDNYSFSPDVTLTVATVGSKLEYGLRTKIWTYSGDTAFQGFASQSDGEVAYSPGSNYILAGAADQAAAYTLYPVSQLPTLTTTVFIDGVEYIFTGDSTELSPLVQLIVAEDTITLAGASGTYTFTPPEGNIFLGLAPSSSVSPTYPIGTYTLGREDTNSVYTLYTVLESLGPLLDTAVIVYSNSGTTLHDSYAASGYGTAPALTLTILYNGLQISNSDGVVSSWTAADPDFFLGFAMQRNATTPSFRPGQSFTIGGGSTDALTNLYVVYSPGYSDINDFEVSSWLVSAVGGFLDFELWPGMSLNEVMWIILVAGVLFWFLKLTI